MIKEIKLLDYQSHKQTELLLHPALNIIVGPSGSGKSAIFRGLRTLMYNSATGTGDVCCPDGVAYTVEVKTDRGTVSRTKGAKINKYTVNGLDFGDVGLTVPEEVLNVTNVCKMAVDDHTELDVNFISQYDVRFILAEDADGILRMKYLNKLSGASRLDDAIKTANSIARKEKSSVKQLTADLKDQTTVQADLVKRHTFKSQLNKHLEQEMQTLVELQQKRRPLANLAQRLANFKTDFQRHGRLKVLLDGVDLLKHSETIHRFTKVQALQGKLDRYGKMRQALEEKKASLSTLNIPQYIEQIAKLKKLLNACVRLSEIITDLNSLKQRQTEGQKTYDSAKQEYILGIKQLGKCPVCLTNIDTGVIEKIAKSL
jgi:exonuclease SbcC